MDPTTLYLLIKIGSAPERGLERPFESVAACEDFMAKISEKARSEVVRYTCQAYKRGQTAPPSWYTANFDQRVIHGVPLDLQHMPKR